MEPRSHHLWKSIFFILLVIALGLGGYYWWQAERDAEERRLVAEKPMVLETFDIPAQVQSGVATRPGNFPNDLTIFGKLTESSYVRFEEGGTTQGTVAFETNKPLGSTADFYKDYLTTHKYEFSETHNGEVRALAGVSEKANINIVLSPRGEKVYVQITYLLFGN